MDVNVQTRRMPMFDGAEQTPINALMHRSDGPRLPGIESLIATFCRGQTPVAGAPRARRIHKQSDQVRRWREVLNDGAETPGEKIPGMWRTMGMAHAASNLATAGGFRIGILQASRMFHPASVGVSDAMQPLSSLSKC